MKTKTIRLPAILFLAAVVLLSGGTATAQSDSVLGDNGVLYSAQAGLYGELFPGGTAAYPENVVLKLVIERGDLGVEEHVVPGTEDDAVEVNPSLLVESGAGDVHLLWESWRGVLHTSIHLTSLGDDGWTNPIEVTGAPFVLKSSPRLLLTRDEISLPDDEGNRVRQQRTILHLAWVEDAATDDERIMYSPLMLLDGRHVASGQAVALNELVPPLEEQGEPVDTYELDQPMLSLRSGQDSRSVVIAFSDRPSKRLVSLELRVLPGEISYAADQLYDLIAGQPGSATASSDDLGSLAELARAKVEEAGSLLQPVVRRELAQQIQGFIAGQEPGMEPRVLAEASRDELVDEGIELTESGIQKITGRRRPHWVDFGYRPPKPATANRQQARSYQIASRLASEKPTPAAVQQPGIELMVSADGEAIALLWQSTEELLYQESAGKSGWSQTNRLRLGEAISPEGARRLVQNRIDKK